MFFANHERSLARRRGVVLILVLGMLSLMALIGVTFATFAGQSLVGNRNFAQGASFPTSEQCMDFALSQLINDTNNPMSAIRGHSLLRDMYGNDSLMTGNTGAFRCAITARPDGVPLQLTAGGAYGFYSSARPVNLTGYLQYTTNIPATSYFPALYGADFTRWTLRVPASGNNVASTYEILEDDVFNGFHVFTLSALDPLTTTANQAAPPTGSPYTTTADPYQGQPVTRLYLSQDNPQISSPTNLKGIAVMNSPLPVIAANAPVAFTLDCRYQRAFNGTGMTHANAAGVPFNSAAYANFRVNGNLLAYAFNSSQAITGTAYGDPSSYAMDEDYDACDLENWYLALQSADGSVMIPSFHRPGILQLTDWTNVYTASGTASDAAAVMSMSKILRPRRLDNSPNFPADPIPHNGGLGDPKNGKITYDIDNDGDGLTDSVWLDLGFPVQRDARGLSFKPLFAFMVIGLNGRLPLNTVGNLQSRDFQVKTTTDTANPPKTPAPFVYEYGPANILDGPTWSHASHLGYSVNEINPLFALQNAPTLVYGASMGPFSQHDNSTVTLNYPNAGGAGQNTITVPGATVDVVQLRNLLAGTVPATNPTANDSTINGDSNYVMVAGSPYYMPNGMYDTTDVVNGSYVTRSNTAVPGRWGEPNGIPKYISPTYWTYSTPNGIATINSLIYPNPVRAGRSGFYGANGWTTNDNTDDDFDAYDFYPFVGTVPSGDMTNGANSGEGFYYTNPPSAAAYMAGNFYDSAGALQLPVERMRSWTSPTDPAGVGRVVAWSERPLNVFDYGTGYDASGRVGFFRYFRPAGVPKVIYYDALYNTGSNAYTRNVYNQPILQGPAILPPAGQQWIIDTKTNMLHSWQSAAAPLGGIGATNSWTKAAGIAVMGAMPWDFIQGTPASTYFGAAVPGTTPVYPRIIVPTDPAFPAGSTATMTTNINTGQGPLLPPTITSSAVNPDTRAGDYIVMSGATVVSSPTVVNGYPAIPLTSNSSSLNKDEADEMNLYVPNSFDSPYGPSDLEWLYRFQDVDGASLSSRLSQLAPISFMNLADGPARRRLFSTDSYELTNFAYAHDNPLPLTAIDQQFAYNSRFNAVSANNIFTQSASLTAMNYNPNTSTYVLPPLQNPFPLTNIANPGTYATPIPARPTVTFPIAGSPQLPPMVTPQVAHRDRKINLNYPLPVSNDPAEPVRQKWIRETYELFKAILPPQAIDDPIELAQLSQYVVNIIDFRDPDCTSTRFVNTDLMVVNGVKPNDPTSLAFANIGVPATATTLYAIGTNGTHYPYDPTIYDEQIFPKGSASRDSNWSTATSSALGDFLVQHGMEYSPVAISEVLGTAYIGRNASGTVPDYTMTRLAVELVNTLTDDGIVPAPNSSSDFTAVELDGWDLIVVADAATGSDVNFAGRPDPITGAVPRQFTDYLKANPTTTLSSDSVRQAIITKTPAPHTGADANQFNFASANTTIKALDAGTPSAKYFTMASPNPATATIVQWVSGSNAKKTGEDKLFDTTPDATFPSGFLPPSATNTPPAVANSTKWFWVYLRRPANPFDGRQYTDREMVVVDSMRFPVGNTGATATNGNGTPGNTDTVTAGTQANFSVSRRQPYRGGHYLPPLPNTTALPGGVAVIPSYAYGYSEQTAVPNTGSANTMKVYYGDAASPPIATVYHNIGDSSPPNPDTQWDYFPFNDRDFTSVAELLLVPGCSPGLFTKQFVYENDPTAIIYNGVLDGSITAVPNDPGLHGTSTAPDFTGGPSRIALGSGPRTYPYLIDKFYYTGMSVQPGSTDYVTNPYTKINGSTGDGWFKIFEFVEIPSSANGAVGPVASGNNFDWFRQDVKPGLLNLNLIIDEEVFFGLMDDQRLNTNLARVTGVVPTIVTQVDQFGYPSYLGTAPNQYFTGAYAMSDRGYTVINPMNGAEVVTGMKAAFSDFLKIRAGGSGYLFAWGSGVTGSGPYSPATVALPALLQNPPAAERPFRSFAYPDINYTIMRPATLPPSALTVTAVGAAPGATMYPPYRYATNNIDFVDGTGTAIAPAPVGTTSFVGDPGIRNPFLAMSTLFPRQLPQVPSRRLFQVPDSANGSTGVTPTTPASASAEYYPGIAGNGYTINQPIVHPNLSSNGSSNVQTSNLFLDVQTGIIPPGAPNDGSVTPLTVNQYLGAGVVSGVYPPTSTNPDNRQHPYFRTEMMQKVMNLTTVRTHQFAVWITVGFFEVLKAGSPTLGYPDQLGAELGLISGKNVRYRSFFLLDRTHGVGWNNLNPQDFRDLVVYRRRIE